MDELHSGVLLGAFVALPAAPLAWWLGRRALRRRLQDRHGLLRELMQRHEQERLSLAHELREEIGQCLSALHAEALAARGGASQPRLEENLDAILAISARLKHQLRGLLLRLSSEARMPDAPAAASDARAGFSPDRGRMPASRVE